MDLFAVEIFVSLLAAVALIALLADRLKVPYPILLVIGGLGISFVPGLPSASINPQLVFLVFLPPLLYHGGMLTSWRDFRANLRAIGLLAIGLVVFTTILIGLVAHGFVGVPWPAAFALGAIVSPTDAVAATAIAQRLNIPRRVQTILEGESLVNDATGLVAYRFAVAAALSIVPFSPTRASLEFVWLAAGGIAIGLGVGSLVAWLRPRVKEPSVDGMVSLLTPYFAYLPAERLHVSGVLAAVTCGVVLSRKIPRVVSATNRLRLNGMWEIVDFFLNGLIFILVGLQLPSVVHSLGRQHLPTLILQALLISVACVLIRILWVFPATYLPRWLIPAVRRRDPSPPWRSVFVVSWTGMRGIVSLAAALALPDAFPMRDWIIFVTFGVILFTLVMQGLTLPSVIRGLHMQVDPTNAREEALARLEIAHAALARLEGMSFLGESPQELIDKVREPYDMRVRYLFDQAQARRALPERTDMNADDFESLYPAVCTTGDQVRRQALTAERQMLVKLRDDNMISDDVLRRIQQELDLDESKLEASEGRMHM